MFNTCNTCWAEDAFMDNNDADREIFMVSNNMFPLWGVLLVIMDAADDDDILINFTLGNPLGRRPPPPPNASHADSPSLNPPETFYEWM